MYATPVWLFAPLFLALILAATELGFRYGRRTRARQDESEKSFVAAVEGGILAYWDFAPEGPEMANLLRNYVEARLQFAGEDSARMDAARDRAAALQTELWSSILPAFKRRRESVLP